MRMCAASAGAFRGALEDERIARAKNLLKNRKDDCCDRCGEHDHATREDLYGPNGEELCCKCGKDIARDRLAEMLSTIEVESEPKAATQ